MILVEDSIAVEQKLMARVRKRHGLVLFNKPNGVLCQFSDNQHRTTLASYIHMPNFYPAGRLDFNTEGLVLLTNNGVMQARICEPRFGLKKTYLAQVEGSLSRETISRLNATMELRDGPAKVISAKRIKPPTLWTRIPPIRIRKSIPTSWIKITIDEGRNRQVRRMTASVGLPTLRLIRTQVGPWSLCDIPSGNFKVIYTNLPTF